jgi:cobalt-zinc-cadmium efflux system membrane fusion protein
MKASLPLSHLPILAGFALPAILCASCGPVATAQEPTPAPTTVEIPPMVVTLYTEQAQLFVEYPRLVVGENARFLAHVTVLADGQPVRSGKARWEVGPVGNPLQVLEVNAPKRDGLFLPEGSFPTPGDFAARFIVESEQLNETFVLPNFVVHASRAEAAAIASAAAEGPTPTDTVDFYLEQQWAIGMRAEEVTRRTLTEWLPVPATIHARPESLSSVGAPVNGMLLQDEGHPHIGDKVQAGQLLGHVEAPLTTADRAQLETVRTDLLAREMEFEAKQIDIRQDLLKAQAEVDYAQSHFERLQAMGAKGLGTDAERDAAQRDVQVAEVRLAGAKQLQESFASSAARLAELRVSLAADLGAKTARGMRYSLYAPIEGELIEAEAHLGDPVHAQEVLFRILDAERVWVHAQVSEFALGRLEEGGRARLRTPLAPQGVYDLAQDLDGSLLHVGRLVDPQDRTVTLRYEIHNPGGKFPIGMFVDMLLATRESQQGLAVPESAIVRDLGRDVVYVVLSGETFQRREVTLGIQDSGFVEILSGLEEGERVVTEQAFRVKLASASPAAFGEGHTH